MTTIASRLRGKRVDADWAEEVVDSIIEAIDPIASRVELVDLLRATEVVDSTTDVVDPITVETKMVNSFIDDEVINPTWPMTLVVDAMHRLDATVEA